MSKFQTCITLIRCSVVNQPKTVCQKKLRYSESNFRLKYFLSLYNVVMRPG